MVHVCGQRIMQGTAADLLPLHHSLDCRSMTTGERTACSEILTMMPTWVWSETPSRGRSHAQRAHPSLDNRSQLGEGSAGCQLGLREVEVDAEPP